MKPTYRLTRTWLPCLTALSCAPEDDSDTSSQHAEASVDALRVSTVDGVSYLAQGRTVKVEADVWGAASGTSALGFFQAADAHAPQWVHLATLPTTAGAQTLSTTFTLHDFTAPAIGILTPSDGATLSGMVQVEASASDARGGISRVELYLGSTRLATLTSAPYVYSLNTRGYANGSYWLGATAYDGAGNSNKIESFRHSPRDLPRGADWTEPSQNDPPQRHG